LFVASAVSTDKTMDAMRFVLCEPDGETSRFVATDGHRAHWATMSEAHPAGAYEVIKKSKTELVLRRITDAGQFPDYRSCIPAKTELDISVDVLNQVWKTYTIFNRAHKFQDLALDYKYFCEAVSTAHTISTTADPHQPVVFTGNYTGAVVMPCRM